jgi:acyl dehydratase
VSRASERRFLVSEDRIRAYSRRGNYHSDAQTAAALGLPGLVAQGAHVIGPAYGALLDAWGDTFLEHGEIDVKFVGVVMAEEEIITDVAIDDGTAKISVENASTGRTAAVGEARRETTQ